MGKSLLQRIKRKIAGKNNKSPDAGRKSASADKSSKGSNKVPARDPNELEAPYRPTIQSITAAGIETYWKKPEDCSGYEIYRSYDPDDIGELAMVINDKLLGVWTDSTFDHNSRVIYYRVRSFLNEKDGSKRYSDYCEQFRAEYRNEMELEREVTYMHSGSERRIRAFYGWGEVEDAVWSVSDEAVASIDNKGIINGLSKGECTVTCKSPSLGIEKSAKIVVDRSAPEPLTEITSRFEKDPETGIWFSRNSDKDKNTDNNDTVRAVIMMVGDMMCGKGQIENQYDEETGWNFNGSFDYVREITAESDFTIGNLETLLDPAWPYMTDEWFINNISNCNAPPRYLDAIKYGGFDGVIMANNHSCDGGVMAIRATLDQVDKYQLVRTGAFKDSDEKRYVIADINGIKVGFVAYMSLATGYNGKDRRWSQADKDVILNNFSKEKAAVDIAECRAAGAEYIIAYMHWGQKNFRKPTEVQKKEAQDIADAGADFILGSNPHVLECFDYIYTAYGAEDSAAGGAGLKKVPCYYSVGNFHARMNQVTGNRDSVIVRITLQRDASGEVVLIDNTYIPCYTYNRVKGSYLAPVSVSESYHEGLKRKSRKETYRRIKASIGDKVTICDEQQRS